MTLARSNPARKCEERETSRQFYLQLKEHLSYFNEEAADLNIENNKVPVLRLKLQVSRKVNMNLKKYFASHT